MPQHELLFQISIPSLERALKDYSQNPSDVPFDLKSVPVAAIPTAGEDIQSALPTEGMLVSTGPAKPVPMSREENYSEKLSAIPGIQQLGPLFRTCDTVELTESETEYVVRCVKHTYTNHLVLQVSVTIILALLKQVTTRSSVLYTELTYIYLSRLNCQEVRAIILLF